MRSGAGEVLVELADDIGERRVVALPARIDIVRGEVEPGEAGAVGGQEQRSDRRIVDRKSGHDQASKAPHRCINA